jgi:hypothetical protein
MENENEDKSEQPISSFSANGRNLGDVAPNRINVQEEAKQEGDNNPIHIRLNNPNDAFSSSSSPSSSLSSHKSWTSEQRKKNKELK